MPLTLSLNTNPLVNRFADPDDLIHTVARDLRIRDLQLTHEFINPSWPAPSSAGSPGRWAPRSGAPAFASPPA